MPSIEGKLAKDIKHCEDCPLLAADCKGYEAGNWSKQAKLPCYTWESNTLVYKGMTKNNSLNKEQKL